MEITVDTTLINAPIEHILHILAIENGHCKKHTAAGMVAHSPVTTQGLPNAGEDIQMQIRTIKGASIDVQYSLAHKKIPIVLNIAAGYAFLPIATGISDMLRLVFQGVQLCVQLDLHQLRLYSGAHVEPIANIAA